MSGSRCVIAVCFALFLLGCKRSSRGDDLGGKRLTAPSVVVTNFVIFDAVRAVLGDALNKDVNVVLLIKPGMEVHNYDPTVSDIVAIHDSSLFIYIGGESDAWVGRTLSAGDADVNVLRLWDFVDTQEEPDVFNSDKADRELDEHVWLSPSNEIRIVGAVYDAINAIFPLARTAADFYISQIATLDKAMQDTVASFVGKGRTLVVADRFPFAYFTSYYKIPYVAALNGCSSVVEPNIAAVGRIETLLKSQQIPVVYYIELSNRAICNVICDECKVDAKLLHSMQNVTQQEFDEGATYVSIMTSNMHALEQ